MQLELKRNLLAGSRAKVLDDPRQAQAVVHFLQEERRKDILSLTREGRVREYRLHYRVAYRVHDGKGEVVGGCRNRDLLGQLFGASVSCARPVVSRWQGRAAGAWIAGQSENILRVTDLALAGLMAAGTQRAGSGYNCNECCQRSGRTSY